MIRYCELVAKTMPPEKRAMASKCLVGHYLVRPISNVISIPLIERGVSATSVTMLSAVFPVAALLLFPLSKGLPGFVTGWILIFIWNVLDGVDGNIARYTGTASRYGGLWDAAVGWLATVSFYVGMGFCAFRLGSVLGGGETRAFFPFLGAMTGICWIFPRLVMYKRMHEFGDASAEGVRDRQNFGLLKTVYFNVTSINGFGAVIFLLAMLTGTSDACMLAYFCLGLAMAIASTARMLTPVGRAEGRE